MTITYPTHLAAVLGASSYGTPRPYIAARFAVGTPPRVARATALCIAAKVELETPAGEHWHVEVADPDDHFTPPTYDIIVNLVWYDDPREDARAMVVLRRVVAAMRGPRGASVRALARRRRLAQAALPARGGSSAVTVRPRR